MTKKLAYMPYAQAHALLMDGAVALVSYRTMVIAIDADGWLTCTGKYSVTTIRHMTAFLKEYAPAITWRMAYDAYLYHEKLNVYTGELLDLE